MLVLRCLHAVSFIFAASLCCPLTPAMAQTVGGINSGGMNVGGLKVGVMSVGGVSVGGLNLGGLKPNSTELSDNDRHSDSELSSANSSQKNSAHSSPYHKYVESAATHADRAKINRECVQEMEAQGLSSKSPLVLEDGFEIFQCDYVIIWIDHGGFRRETVTAIYENTVETTGDNFRKNRDEIIPYVQQETIDIGNQIQVKIGDSYMFRGWEVRITDIASGLVQSTWDGERYVNPSQIPKE